MSLDGERARTSSMAGFHEFYNSPTFSDIKLKFPRSKIVIHAHKVILAAGSGFFKRKLLLEGKDVTEWQLDEEDGDGIEAAIRYMYGFDVLGEGDYHDGGSVEEFVEVGAIAEKYDITGLSELVLSTASHALNNCVSNETKIAGFLHVRDLSPWVSGTDEPFDYAVKIIENNLTMLRKHAVFQELLCNEPGLAVALVNFLGERQS